jgi:hypothetical protein
VARHTALETLDAAATSSSKQNSNQLRAITNDFRWQSGRPVNKDKVYSWTLLLLCLTCSAKQSLTHMQHFLWPGLGVNYCASKQVTHIRVRRWCSILTDKASGIACKAGRAHDGPATCLHGIRTPCPPGSHEAFMSRSRQRRMYAHQKGGDGEAKGKARESHVTNRDRWRRRRGRCEEADLLFIPWDCPQ